jgi:hypothetical protein
MTEIFDVFPQFLQANNLEYAMTAFFKVLTIHD